MCLWWVIHMKIISSRTFLCQTFLFHFVSLSNQSLNIRRICFKLLIIKLCIIFAAITLICLLPKKVAPAPVAVAVVSLYLCGVVAIPERAAKISRWPRWQWPAKQICMCVCMHIIYIYIPYVVVSERMAVRPFTKAQQEIRCNFTSKWGNGSLNPSSFPTKSDVSYIPLYPYVSHPTVLQRHIKSNSVFKKIITSTKGSSWPNRLYG